MDFVLKKKKNYGLNRNPSVFLQLMKDPVVWSPLYFFFPRASHTTKNMMLLLPTRLINQRWWPIEFTVKFGQYRVGNFRTRSFQVSWWVQVKPNPEWPVHTPTKHSQNAKKDLIAQHTSDKWGLSIGMMLKLKYKTERKTLSEGNPQGKLVETTSEIRTEIWPKAQAAV